MTFESLKVPISGPDGAGATSAGGHQAGREGEEGQVQEAGGREGSSPAGNQRQGEAVGRKWRLFNFSEGHISGRHLLN